MQKKTSQWRSHTQLYDSKAKLSKNQCSNKNKQDYRENNSLTQGQNNWPMSWKNMDNCAKESAANWGNR